MANVSNAKVNESWHVSRQKREALLMGIFAISSLGQFPSNCKKHFFDCRKPGRHLARILPTPGRNLEPRGRNPTEKSKSKGESGAGTSLAETRQNPAECGATGRNLAARETWHNPVQPGVAGTGRTRQNSAETSQKPGATRQKKSKLKATPEILLIYTLFGSFC